MVATCSEVKLVNVNARYVCDLLVANDYGSTIDEVVHVDYSYSVMQ